jgi:hypothetical protein
MAMHETVIVAAKFGAGGVVLLLGGLAPLGMSGADGMAAHALGLGGGLSAQSRGGENGEALNPHGKPPSLKSNLIRWHCAIEMVAAGVCETIYNMP